MLSVVQCLCTEESFITCCVLIWSTHCVLMSFHCSWRREALVSRFFVGIAAVADQIDKHSKKIRDIKNAAEELKVGSKRSALSSFVFIQLRLSTLHIDLWIDGQRLVHKQSLCNFRVWRPNMNWLCKMNPKIWSSCWIRGIYYMLNAKIWWGRFVTWDPCRQMHLRSN